MAAPDSLIEISRSLDRGHLDADFWVGLRVYTVNKDEADEAFTHLAATPWTTPESVTFNPKRIELENDWPEDPGRSLMTVRFETEFNPSRFPSGGSTMYVRTRNRTKKRVKDFSDPVLDVETVPDENGYYTTPLIPGSNIVLDPGTIVVINTAAVQATLNWNALFALVGKTNAAALPNIGNAAKETFLLRNIIIPTYFLYNSGVTNVPISYELEYDVTGWIKTDPFVHRLRKTIKRLPVYHRDDVGDNDDPKYTDKNDPDGASTGTIADALLRNFSIDEAALMPKPNGARETDVRVMYETGDFSALNSLAFWSTP